MRPWKRIAFCDSVVSSARSLVSVSAVAVGHVGVQHAGLAGDAVDRGVDEHRRRFHRWRPASLRPGDVDHHDVVGLHLAPQQAARVQQEAARRVGQFHAEVVAHAFGQAVVRGGAQGQGQVGAQPGDGGGSVVVFVHRGSFGVGGHSPVSIGSAGSAAHSCSDPSYTATLPWPARVSASASTVAAMPPPQ
jgi:hypothetical protein